MGWRWNRRRFGRILYGCGLILICGTAFWIATAGLLGYAIYYYPQQTLTVDSGDVRADAIVVLGGGRDERPQRAAELFKQGAAPQILVSGFGDCDANIQLLEINGVPANVITREGNSISTYENAKFSIPLLRQMGAHRVIIVTAWFHSRRALTCFEHYASDMQFYSRPSYFSYQPTPWNRENVDSYVKSEYDKILYYWVWYGVCPFYWR